MKTRVNWITRPRVTLIATRKKHKPNNILKTSISQSARPSVQVQGPSVVEVTRASLAGVECVQRYMQSQGNCAAAMRPFLNYFDHLLLLGRIALQICGLLLPMFCVLEITVSSAETDGPIEILFRMWTQMNPRNYVFDGDRTCPEKTVIFGGRGG